MANFYGSARSNYVKVDASKLEALEALFPIETVTKDGRTAILSQDEAGTPSIFIEDGDQEDWLDLLGVENADNIDDLGLLDVIHLVLQPGEIIVWLEVGAEKLRYLTGLAIAINDQGEVVKRISIGDVYEGTDWTRAEY